MSTVAVILAAGLGKRMKSDLPKVLHPVLGDAVLLWVLRALPAEVSHAVLVLHHGRDKVETALAGWVAQGLLPCPVTTVDQAVPLGTGHAVQAAEAELDRLGATRVVILCGDVPLVEPATVRRLAGSEAVLLAMDLPDPTGYGRVVQREDGTLAAIVEHKDADEATRAIKRVNGGAYALPWAPLKAALAGLTNDNAQGEYYLTDAVAEVGRRTPVAVELCEPAEMLGMNSRLDQAALQAFARERINARWMAEGVTFQDPASTLVGPRVELGRDVVLGPSVQMEGRVAVGRGTVIGMGCVLSETTLGEDVELRAHSVAQRAVVGDGAKVGPFAHLREGSVLEQDVHVGNFVETKKTLLRRGAKANHLSYLGDAEVGSRTNVGAGLITCNYDGFNKHRTVIGEGVFVGSDCQLVAPVTIGDGAVLGAGSCITRDIPAQALALTRAPLVVKPGGAVVLREKLIAAREQA